ncbi:outer membrane protein assembly factor BamD precursor [bacterium BMS3Abin03]|nr:outer membrane protein assembly factor BamD precursor [bacterium BMS3Abin03]
MKFIVILPFVALLFWGCSSSIDVANFTPEERLQYAIKLYEDEDYEEAVKEFEALLLQYPGSSIVDDAQFYLAKTRFGKHEYIIAAYEFSKLIKNMPASPLVPDAQFMLAECYYELSPNYNLDQSYTKKAIQEYQAFIDFFPLNERVQEAENKINKLNDKLAKKEYSIAKIYEKMDYYNASMKYYDYVVETYHDTPYAPKALYKKIMLLIERKREGEALTETKKFLALYPEDEHAEEINQIKSSLEEKISLN